MKRHPPSWSRPLDFQDGCLYRANAMVDQHVGLEGTDDGVWSIYFSTILLATFDETRLHHHRLTEVLPMFPDTSVTHHPGCSCATSQASESLTSGGWEMAATIARVSSIMRTILRCPQP